MSKRGIGFYLGIILLGVGGILSVSYQISKKMRVQEEINKLNAKNEGMMAVRQEAVKAGVARWVSDEVGNPKFEWIIPPEKKQ